MLLQKHMLQNVVKSEKNSEILRHAQASLHIFLTSIYMYYILDSLD